MVRTKIFKDVCCNEVDLEKKRVLLEKELDGKFEDLIKTKELAVIYHYTGEDKKAIEIYEKLLKNHPEDTNVLAFLGYLHYELDELEEAIDYFNRSLDIDSASPFVFFLLGNAYSREGMIREAIDAYDFAIFLDFDMYQAHLDFAVKYEDMGRKKRALKEYVAAYEIDSRDKELLEKITILGDELKGA
jgi:tetratricopeptide (TPR) repeat protein